MSGPVADEFADIAARLKEIEQATAARVVATQIELSTEVKTIGEPRWSKSLIPSINIDSRKLAEAVIEALKP